jgi:hypothetical protein
MSKLQALAAKRRQQAAQKPPALEASQESSSDYAESLNKLRISQSRTTKPEATISPPTEKDTPMIEADQSVDTAADEKAQGSEDEVLFTEPLKAQPSAFASILNESTQNEIVETELPPGNRSQGTGAFDFTEPSPDDLVSKAQKRLRS